MNIVVCSKELFQGKAGRHLIDPDGYYMREAIAEVGNEREDYTIFVHLNRDGLNYKISQEVMDALVNCGFHIAIVSPVDTENNAKDYLKRRNIKVI